MTAVTTRLLDVDDVRRSLSVRDLTDQAHGPHAMQILLDGVVEALREAWKGEVLIHGESPIVSVEENYDALHYPPEGASREARYTRYLNGRTILRTQTSVMIPGLLRYLARRCEPWSDVLLVCPGLTYRRDAIDRLHTGEPHQLDLWRVRDGEPLGDRDLQAMIDTVVAALLPGAAARCVPAEHPYTVNGLQIDVRWSDAWV